MTLCTKLILALTLSFTNLVEVGTTAQFELKHSNAIQKASAYEMMEVVFIGKPSKSTIQPLLEGVMKKYKLPIAEDNLLRASSALVSLRKNSNAGITEMQKLRHMYQHGANGGTFPSQAGMSASLLEMNLK